jgi:hypothetical protein
VPDDDSGCEGYRRPLEVVMGGRGVGAVGGADTRGREGGNTPRRG